jgi:hypothetical protein
MRYYLCVLLVALALGCGSAPDAPVPGKAAGPSADKEGQSWNHTELLAHLKKRGVVFATSERHGLSVIFKRRPGDPARDEDACVLITLYPSADMARLAVSPLGQQQAFAWGKFGFVAGQGSFLAEIRKVLLE